MIPTAPDDYDPHADIWASVRVAFEAIRQRVRDGGPGWTPPPIKEVSRETDRSS